MKEKHKRALIASIFLFFSLFIVVSGISLQLERKSDIKTMDIFNQENSSPYFVYLYDDDYEEYMDIAKEIQGEYNIDNEIIKVYKIFLNQEEKQNILVNDTDLVNIDNVSDFKDLKVKHIPLLMMINKDKKVELSWNDMNTITDQIKLLKASSLSVSTK